MLETTTFEGHSCVRLRTDDCVLFVTVSVGPRILGLLGAGGDGPNLMAVLPDATLERPDGGRFRLLGGHRLWAAPEVPAISYEPDDRACSVTELADGIRVEAPRDGAGFVKALEIRSADEVWIVDHELRNGSEETVTVAAWGITQVRPGGRAILPLGDRGVGPQADRALVLWPYTDLDDPRLGYARDGVTVHAVAGAGPAKVGAAPGEGRVAYRIDGQLFEKRIAVDPALRYPDRGATVQVFVQDHFCELETLGPLVTLPPGGSTTHRETWSLRDADG